MRGGGVEGRATKLDTDVTQCSNFPYNDPLNPNLLGFIGSILVCDRYGIPGILNKYIKESIYGVITRKEGNIPDYAHLV